MGLRWVPQNPIDDKSTLVQVMVRCNQATSHYHSQCWARPLLKIVLLNHNELTAVVHYVYHFSVYECLLINDKFCDPFLVLWLKKKRNKKWKAIIVNTLYNPINMCIVDVTILVSSHLFKSRQRIKRSGTHMMKPTCSCFTWSQHPWPYKPGWHHKILPSKPNQELITQVPVIMRYNF